MTCREVVESLNLYVDGRLRRRKRLALRCHLLLCRDCRNYLRGYVSAVRAAKAAMREPQVKPDIPEHLVQAILATRGSSTRG